MRKKSGLSLHRRKNRRSDLVHVDVPLNVVINAHNVPKWTPSKSNKRKMSPWKSPLKTPFKSPLYKAYKISNKKSSSRSLFGPSDDNEEVIGTILDDIPDEQSTITIENYDEPDEFIDCCKRTIPATGNCESSLNIDSFVSTVKTDAESVCNESKSSDKNNDMDEVIQEMLFLIPDVVSKLSNTRNALHLTLLDFLRLVVADAFPLDNIALMLWLEVVKWYTCKNTTRMRYSETTKLFWKLGWRMFGGRFINFMCGYKNQQEEKDVHSETLGKRYDPVSSRINFVIPDVKVLRQCMPYTEVTDRKPGFYGDIMVHMGANMQQQSACLTFDGKKIKQGLTRSSGDVDLLGFEDSTSLQERLFDLQLAITEYEVFLCYIDNCKEREKLESLSQEFRQKLQEILLKSLRDTSAGIVQANALKKKKEYAKEKLVEKGGGLTWKESKFAYAISAVLGYIHDIEKYLMTAEKCIRSICMCLSSLNGATYISDVNVNLEKCENYIPLKMQIQDKHNTRLIPQRTDEWFEVRKCAKVTGSTLYKALGLDGLKKQKEYFEHIKCNLPEQEVSEQAKLNMQHGTLNEENAVATIVSKIMPIFTPELVFFEEGCVQVFDEDTQPFLVVSPDGSLRESESYESTKVAVEIKCPVYGVHTEFPPRYYLQCQAEIEVLNVDWLLYVSWTDKITSAFKVKRDFNIFKRAMKMAMDLYQSNDAKKPTKLVPEVKALKDDIAQQCKLVEFLGLFPSAKSCYTDIMSKESVISIDQFRATIDHVKSTKSDFYELSRERASEAVVFLCTELNRSWKKEQLKCAPVAWFPKGYSLRTPTMRNIAEQVHNMCHEANIHVPCESFDGQWHNIVVRSLKNEPLTILQLQKDVWAEVQKMKKTDIVTALKQFNRNPIIINETTQNENLQSNTIRVVANGLEKVPLLRDCKAVNNNEETTPDAIDISTNVEYDNFEVEGNDVPKHVDGLEYSVDLETEVDDDKEVHEEKNSNSTNCDTERPSDIEEVLLDEADIQQVLLMLRVDKVCNSKNKWDSVSVRAVMDYFQSTNSLNKLLNSELTVVLRYLKRVKEIDIKDTSTKRNKILFLAKYLKLQIPEMKKNKPVKTVMKPLYELAAKVVTSNATKHALNRIYAELIWPERYKQWKEHGASQAQLTSNTECLIQNWFYQPEYSDKRKQLEVRCIDATHLLTRTRRKSCRGGLDNSSKISWLNVAKTGKTMLTPIMVEEITDPMSSSMAATHFSEEVEREMRLLEDGKTADLCHDIRLWWESEDKAGIPAMERVRNRCLLRNRLFKEFDFGKFPPVTMHVNGWPLQLWEALIAHIDAKALLYSLCHGGTYNVRAFSSLAGETFFSELTLNDKRGQGTVTTEEFGQFVGNSIEQMQARLDPDRTFVYRTGRTHVYNLLDKSDMSTPECERDCAACVSRHSTIVKEIIVKDHMFDRRSAKKKKSGTVCLDRNSLQKGALGVRWEKARRNDSKTLVTSKMGLLDIQC